jgi:predicted signal transduction protein with EAL and GGDEF domain
MSSHTCRQQLVRGKETARGSALQLQSKILLLLIPLIIVPILVLGWMAYSLLMDDASQRTRFQITTLLEQIESQTETQLRTARANANLFASTALVKQYIRAQAASRDTGNLEQQVMNLLLNYQLAYPEYYEIRILTRDGKEQLRSVLGKSTNRTTDESSSKHFIEAAAHPDVTYTTFFRNPDNDQPALLTSKPLYLLNKKGTGTQKELYGYLMLTIDLGFMATQAGNNNVAENGEIFFTDNSGTILFHPSAALVGKELPADLFNEAKQHARGNTRIDGQYQGKSGHYQLIKLHDRVYAFVAYHDDELLAKSIRLGRTVTQISFVAILLAITFLFAILKKLLITPIQKLGLAAKEIGRGHVLVPIDIDSRDEIGALATTFREMGENLHNYHEQVRYVAYHDNLTGLPNRLMFMDYLNRATTAARREKQGLAILFLDIDNFKRINDTLGHQTGDKLLEAFADRLSKQMRETDVISRPSREDHPKEEPSNVFARLAGDEFIILLPGSSATVEADKVARRILKSLSEPFVVWTQELHVSASIGIAMYPEDGETAGDLLKHADIAMYHAKKLGRNNYQYFSKKLNEASAEKLKIENKLRHALENKALELHYQPQVNLVTGQLSGVEALLRWEDPELGKVSPAVFIPIAEEFGLIVQISEWVINEACRQAQQWITTLNLPVTMSINISAVHFNGHNLESMIADALKTSGLNPGNLELELTETSILQDLSQAIETLETFKNMGLQLALDDFGTGYSSLSYLMKLPFDKLKIDQSFIFNLKKETKGTAIVAAIISMSHSLGMHVIAEGVELEEHMQLLLQMHCDQVQGYYISRPLTAGQFENFVRLQNQQSA